MFAERCRSRDDELSPHPELGSRIENIPSAARDAKLEHVFFRSYYILTSMYRMSVTDS